MLRPSLSSLLDEPQSEWLEASNRVADANELDLSPFNVLDLHE